MSDDAGWYKDRIAYTGGVVGWLGFGGHYHVQSGISVSSFSTERTFFGVHTVTNMLYLQVPLNILFTSREDRGFLCGFGAYYGYAVSGGYIITDAINGGGKTQKEKIPFDTPGHYRRRDIGANIAILGWRFRNGLLAHATIAKGLSNISTKDQNRHTPTMAKITIGYLLR